MGKIYSARLVAGIGLSLTAVAAAEATDFSLPSAVDCVARSADTDFGPPLGCDHGPSPHNRTVLLTSLSTSTGTIALAGAFAAICYDGDSYQLTVPGPEQQRMWFGKKS